MPARNPTTEDKLRHAVRRSFGRVLHAAKLHRTAPAKREAVYSETEREFIDDVFRIMRPTRPKVAATSKGGAK